MKHTFPSIVLAACLGAGLAAAAVPAGAAPYVAAMDDGVPENQSPSQPPFLQCVPYARQVSGVQIFGDAHTWWDQAAGKYQRGTAPRVGAVMSFRPYGSMVLGHVAAVSRVIDSRTVLLRHSNWSPINGRRGQIEDNVRAIDVSPDNDWSEVRVWFAPLQALGTTRWPVNGFIYPQKARPGEAEPLLARATRRPAPDAGGDDFTRTFAAFAPRPASRPAFRPAPARALSVGYAPQRVDAAFLAGIRPEAVARPAKARAVKVAADDSDPIGRIIAARMK